MAVDRDRKGQPGNDFSDLVFSEYWDLLEQQADETAKQARNTGGRSRSANGGASRSGQRREAGRHTGSVRADSERHGAPPPPKPAKRRRTSQQIRRQRKIMGTSLLFLLIGAIFLVNSITVSRVKELQVSSSTVDQQILTWKGSRDADGYEIYDGGGTLLAQLDAAADTQYAVDGLKSGTQYTYSVVAVKNFLGTHASRAAKCSAYTMLEPVPAVTVTNSGSGVLLNWEDSGAGGYEVQYTDGAGQAQSLEAKSGGQSLSIPDLQEGTQYMFLVRSFLQDGEDRVYSDWTASEPVTAVRTADLTGIDITKPMVALTFDDGPDYEDVTTRILDTLKEYGGHATFFQLGNRADRVPALLTRIVEEGHEIACHTYDHTHYGADVSSDDIIRANDAIEQACGKRPSAFRSPGGETTDFIRQTCAQEGIPIFSWSLDTADWQSRDADSVCDVVMNNIEDGDIVLMHNIYHSTADAVDRIVPYLVENGYQLVTASQLVLAKTGRPPEPGIQYVNATVTK